MYSGTRVAWNETKPEYTRLALKIFEKTIDSDILMANEQDDDFTGTHDSPAQSYLSALSKKRDELGSLLASALGTPVSGSDIYYNALSTLRKMKEML